MEHTQTEVKQENVVKVYWCDLVVIIQKQAPKALCLPKFQLKCKAAMYTWQAAAGNRHAASPGLQQPLPATAVITLQ